MHGLMILGPSSPGVWVRVLPRLFSHAFVMLSLLRASRAQLCVSSLQLACARCRRQACCKLHEFAQPGA